jgi:hypothetical protein
MPLRFRRRCCFPLRLSPKIHGPPIRVRWRCKRSWSRRKNALRAAKKCRPRFEGDSRSEVGNYGEFHGTGGVSLPVSDTFAVRAAVDYERQDGYFSNGLNDRNSVAVRRASRKDSCDRHSAAGMRKNGRRRDPQ